MAYHFVTMVLTPTSFVAVAVLASSSSSSSSSSSHILLETTGMETMFLVEDATVRSLAPDYCDLQESTPSVTIIPHFLEPEACAKYRAMPIHPNTRRSDNDSPMNLAGEVVVEDEHVTKLLHTFGLATPALGSNKQFPTTKLYAQHTHLRNTSIWHLDCYNEGPHKGEITHKNSAFVFLNDNLHAQFLHGNSNPIPVEEGTLVLFPGDIGHHTLIPNGDVHLLGPFDTEELFQIQVVVEPTDAPVTPTCSTVCQWWNIICWILCLLFRIGL